MIPYFQTPSVTLYNENCLDGLAALADNSVQTCVTSPPYFGLRNYQHPEQIGLEKTPDEYIAKLMEVFKQVHRVLQNDGTLFLNLGDSYASSGVMGKVSEKSGLNHGKGVTESTKSAHAFGRAKTPPGLKPKDLIGAPWRAALALQGFAVVPFRSFSTWADELGAAREAQDWSAVEIIERRLRAMDLLSALNAQGWYLRQDIIWAKGCSGAYAGGSVMPEFVTDRCTKAHEYIFLLTKSARYYYDCMATKEVAAKKPGSNGNFGNKDESSRMVKKFTGNMKHGVTYLNKETRNRRSVWTVNTQNYSGAHFATFPPELITPCILAGAPPGCTVLDPFAGSGTTLMVAQNLGRRAVGFELNPDYCKLAVERCQQMTIFDLAPSSAVKKPAPTPEKDPIPAPLLADLV